MCACVTAIVHSMGTKFVTIEEIVSGTHSEDSVTLHLSSLQEFTGKCIVSVYFVHFICKKMGFGEIYDFWHTLRPSASYLDTLIVH